MVAVSLGRVLLLTSGHIIMLRSTSGGGGRGEAGDGPDYRHKWRVRVSEVQAVKGAPTFTLLCCLVSAQRQVVSLAVHVTSAALLCHLLLRADSCQACSSRQFAQ